MDHSAQQMQEQLSRREDLSSDVCSMPLDLDNAGRSQHISEQADTSSLITFPDLNVRRLTTPELQTELQELDNYLHAPETPSIPTTLFPLTEEKEQYWSCYSDLHPQLQPQQHEQTQQQPQPVHQQHVTSGPNVSDSSASMSNPSSSLPWSPEHSAMDDYVKYKTQTVPALGPTPPLWYRSSDEDISGEVSVQQTTTHQAPQQQSRCEELILCERTVTLDLDNVGRSQNISEQARCWSLQALPDLSRLQVTSPEREEFNKGFYVPETPSKPTTLLSRTADQQYASCYADVLPPLQPQQHEQTQQQPQPVLQQHVTSGPHVSDSSASTSNPSFSMPWSPEHSVMDDYVKYKTQTVPALGPTPPLWYKSSDEHISGEDSVQQTTVHQAPQQQSMCEEFSLCKRTVTQDLDNAGLSQHMSEQADTSSPLTSADLNVPQLTTPDIQELVNWLYVTETPSKPTTLLSGTEEQQYPSCYADGLPQLQPQQHEQTQQQAQPVLQQHVTSGPNVSDSSAFTPNPSFSLPWSPEHSAMDDYVKYNTQTVPALGPTPPLWYKSSDEDISGEDSVEQTTVNQAPQQQPRCEEFSLCKRTVNLDLGNVRRSQNISEQARCWSPQTLPDLSRLQLTSPEREEPNMGFYVPETLPKPTTMFSRTEEEQQCPSSYADVLPPLQPQQHEHTQQHPQPVLQQHTTSGPNVADSRKRTMTLDLDNAGPSKQARMMYTVPRPGAEFPLSLVDMRDGERTKLEEKRYRNRIAQAKCRQLQNDRDTVLQFGVDVLKMDTAMLTSIVNTLRCQVGFLRQEVETHVTHCGPIGLLTP
ncbi:hypothetical protein MTO96_037395 [Rhipicephalus appendiculatus]